MKTDVYSWRLSSQKKAELESEARREGTSVAELLERITGEWMQQRQDGRKDEEAEQEAIRARAFAAIGSIHGGDPTFASRASEVIRERLNKRYGR